MPTPTPRARAPAATDATTTLGLRGTGPPVVKVVMLTSVGSRAGPRLAPTCQDAVGPCVAPGSAPARIAAGHAVSVVVVVEETVVDVAGDQPTASEAVSADSDQESGGDSIITVIVAFVANLLIAVAKSVAAVLTASASMLAE